MLVKQLIQELSKQDSEALVVTRGPEGGLEEVEHVEFIFIAFDVHDDEHRGPHAQVFQIEQADSIAVRLR